MWLRRTPTPTPTSNSRIHTSNFSCSSFKDIQSLCSDQPAASSSAATHRRTSSIFRRVSLANSVLRALGNGPSPPEPEPAISLPGSETRIVVYFTSLRVVRRTFDDCTAVRTILRSLRVLIDERDLSMDSRFMEELRKILSGGGGGEKTKLTLPRVFIGGRYVGGADEIRRLNETGELKRHVEGLAPAEPGTCEACGGYRFVLCGECCGSHKCYTEKNGFRSCGGCNENGLIRCPSCSSAPPPPPPL